MQGWIKIYREILNKPIWLLSTPVQKCILITILLMANHEEKEWEWKREKYICKPGQMITSLDKIAKKAGKGVSIQNVRTAITRLEKYGFLTNESTNSDRLITICNWSEYQALEIEQKNANSSFVSPLLVDCYTQGDNEKSTEELTEVESIINTCNTGTYKDTETKPNKEANKQLTGDQQATNKQLTTNKNDKNVKNILYIKGEKKKLSETLFKTLDTLMSDQVYLEILCMNNSIRTIEDMKNYLKTFFVELENRGENYKKEAEAKNHFASWLRIKLKEEAEQKVPQSKNVGYTHPSASHNSKNLENDDRW